MKHSEPKLTRRQMIQASTAVVAGFSMNSSLSQAQPKSKPQAGIPLLHITDLYHPAQDPDDHLDLLTIVALPEFDLKGVVLDVTQKFLVPSGSGVGGNPYRSTQFVGDRLAYYCCRPCSCPHSRWVAIHAEV